MDKLIQELKEYYKEIDDEHKEYQKIRREKKKELGFRNGILSDEVQKNISRVKKIKEEKILINRLIKLMEDR